ncbi:MAG: hypothetical protein P4L22_05280 [Candidatus Babeliales bacterium]|nr:hypothetical protein [Candidatus Babeliales bacterium]
MNKFKIVLFSLSLLLGFNAQSAELTQYVTPKNVAATLATAGAVYGLYRAHCAKKAKKLEEFNAGLRINSALVYESDIEKEEIIDGQITYPANPSKAFRINPETVIAFDIHDVIAKYDVLKMVKKAVLHPMIALSSLRHPGIFKMIAQQVKKGASVQEMFEAIEDEYPGNETIKNIAKLAIDISAQLKPIKGTIDIVTKLRDKGYKVVFVSNMEPKLFKRFVADFPMLEKDKNDQKHESYLPGPDNNWVKKPSEDYFRGCKLPKNSLFIDDRLKNVKPAIECGIPSLVYFSPEQLEDDLRAMGADLD